MSKSSSVLTNTFYQILAKFITASGAFGVTWLITRYLGVEGYGNYTIVITYVTLFYVMVDFGLNNIFLREYGTSDKSFFFNLINLVLLRFFISSLFALLAAIALFFLPFKTDQLFLVRQGVLIGLPLLIFQGLNLSFQAVVQYKQDFSKLVWSSLVGSAVSLGLVWLVVSKNGTLPHLVGVSVVGSVVLAVSLFLLVSRGKYILPTKILSKRIWDNLIQLTVIRKIIKLSVPVGISLVLNVLLTNADKFLLSFLTDSAQVGLYGLASKIFEVMLVVPTFFVAALYPLMLLAKKKSIKNYKKNLSWGLEVALAVALPATIIGTIFAPQLIDLLGGSNFSSASDILRVLLLATVLFYFTSLLRITAIVEGGEKKLPLIYGIGFVFDLVLNLIFIPRFGLAAAAAINGFSEALILLLLFYFFGRSNLLSFNRKRILGILLSCIALALVCWWARNIYFIWPMVGGGVIYYFLLRKVGFRFTISN